jgi:hypothetical protein
MFPVAWHSGSGREIWLARIDAFGTLWRGVIVGRPALRAIS